MNSIVYGEGKAHIPE